MMVARSSAEDYQTENRWLKIAGIAGILFLVTFFVQFLVGPQGPEFNAKSSDVVSFYSQNQTGIELMTLMVCLFAVLYGLFLAGIWGMLRRTNAAWLATLGLVVGIGGSALLFVGYAINLALASYASGNPNVDAAVVAPLFKTASLLTMLLNSVTDGISVLAFSVAILLSGLVVGRARWLAYAGVFGGSMFLLSSLAVFDPAGPAQLAALLGTAGWYIWLVGFSIRLIRGGGATVEVTRTTTQAAPAV
jgi:hypothetical protein